MNSLLVSLMVNSITEESGQKIILEILQLLSEYEYVIKILGEIKGQESPIALLKGLNEQPEQIQIEFLRWVRHIDLIQFIHLFFHSNLVLYHCRYFERPNNANQCTRRDRTIIH